MSSILSQEFKSRGVAAVIVVLKDRRDGARRAKKTAATNIYAGLRRHFVASRLSQSAALAASFGQSGEKRGLNDGAAPASVKVYPELGIMLGTVDRAGLAALRKDPAVADVVGAPQLMPIYPRRIGAAVVPAQVHTWGIERMNVPAVWDRGHRGQGILVGHLDTGVDSQHPALKTAIEQYAEFDELGDEVPDAVARDSEMHGTHTAATIAGRAVDGRSIGVAPEALIASAMVIEGGDLVARVLGGMNWAVGLRVRILSLSLGFPGYWDDFEPVTERLRERGVLPVFAVGNEYAGTSRSPGNYPEVLSVGAVGLVGDKLQVADFSSSQRFNRKQDPLVPRLVGPGVAVISAEPGGGYREMDGTSMATPHIAGLAALLFSAKPEATVAEVEAAICAACTHNPVSPDGRSALGLPDALAALEYLLDPPAADDLTAAARSAPRASTPTRRAAKKSATKRAAKKSAAKTAARKRPSEKPAKKTVRARTGRR